MFSELRRHTRKDASAPAPAHAPVGGDSYAQRLPFLMHRLLQPTSAVKGRILASQLSRNSHNWNFHEPNQWSPSLKLKSVSFT